MKRPDMTVPLGLFIGLLTIGAGAMLEGIRLGFLWQPTAALVVIGGTLGAIIIRRGVAGVSESLRAAWGLFFHESTDEAEAALARLVWLARLAKREGVKALEAHAANQRDPMMVQALLLTSQYAEPAIVRRQLSRILEYEDERGLRDVATLEAAGGFAPTFGILGAVLGLLQVLRALAEPNALGAGIATAFVATIYGVGVANLLLFPLAARLRERHEAQMRHRAALVDGLVALAAHEGPGAIAQRYAAVSGFAEQRKVVKVKVA
jgi:chemotaxis protein MotA